MFIEPEQTATTNATTGTTMTRQEEIHQFFVALKKAKLDEFLDITKDFDSEIIPQMRDAVERNHGKYVISGDNVTVFNKEDWRGKPLSDISYRLGDLYNAFKTQPYTPLVDDTDVGSYWKTKKRFNISGEPRGMRDKVVQISSLRGHKHRGDGQIGLKLRVTNITSGNNYDICEFSLLERIAEVDVVRMLAEQFVDSKITREIDQAKQEKRRLLGLLTEVESEIFAVKDREKMIQNYITIEQATVEAIKTSYPQIQNYQNTPSAIIITFAPGFTMEHRSNGTRLYKAIAPFEFTINKGNWGVTMTSGKHPHVNSSGDLCKGGFSQDFANAAGQRDIYYMIEILWRFLQNCGSSTFSSPDHNYYLLIKNEDNV